MAVLVKATKAQDSAQLPCTYSTRSSRRVTNAFFSVVCPVGLISQWAAEIEKMAIGLRVIEHHGALRTNSQSLCFTLSSSLILG